MQVALSSVWLIYSATHELKTVVNWSWFNFHNNVFLNENNLQMKLGVGESV